MKSPFAPVGQNRLGCFSALPNIRDPYHDKAYPNKETLANNSRQRLLNDDFTVWTCAIEIVSEDSGCISVPYTIHLVLKLGSALENLRADCDWAALVFKLASIGFSFMHCQSISKYCDNC